MVYIENLFSRNCELCGKRFLKEKSQHKCGILPQTHS